MTNKFYTEEFLDALPEDRLEAVVVLCDKFFSIVEHNNDIDVACLLDALAVIQAFCEARGVDYTSVSFSDSTNECYGQVINWIRELLNDTNQTLLRQNTTSGLAAKRALYAQRFGAPTGYSFEPSGFARIQVLITELRDLITDSKLLDDRHRLRLLRRLEAMQAELHEKNSDIDRFWGFIGEVSVAVRKFGDDLKPITERAQEVSRIIVAAIMLKEGIAALPMVTRLLEK
jgi:hypothetical protein